MPSRIDAIDAYQRLHRCLGFPLAVAYKFGDDQGAYLAALIAYYGFLSLFPLLLLLVTILGFVLQNDAQLQEQLLDSALAQVPVILLAPHGGRGAAGAAQTASTHAGAVPRNRRPNPITARLRSLLLLPVLG